MNSRSSTHRALKRGIQSPKRPSAVERYGFAKHRRRRRSAAYWKIVRIAAFAVLRFLLGASAILSLLYFQREVLYANGKFHDGDAAESFPVNLATAVVMGLTAAFFVHGTRLRIGIPFLMGLVLGVLSARGPYFAHPLLPLAYPNFMRVVLALLVAHLIIRCLILPVFACRRTRSTPRLDSYPPHLPIDVIWWWKVFGYPTLCIVVYISFAAIASSLMSFLFDEWMALAIAGGVWGWLISCGVVRVYLWMLSSRRPRTSGGPTAGNESMFRRKRACRV